MSQDNLTKNREDLISEYIKLVLEVDNTYLDAIDHPQAGHHYPAIGPDAEVHNYEIAKARLDQFKRTLKIALGAEYLTELKQEGLTLWNKRYGRKDLD